MRFDNRDLRLALHLFIERERAMEIDTACIDEGERASKGFRVRVEAVARDPLLFIDNGDPLLANPVEKGRFSHIGAADKGNFRFHIKCWGRSITDRPLDLNLFASI